MNRMRRILIFLLIAAFILLTACNTVRGSGDLITETRNVSGFHSISLSGMGDVIVNQGEGESLTIETDDNVMEHITSEVRDGTLRLGVEELTSISPTRLVFTVGLEELTGLSISGSGSIHADGVETDSLDIKVSGSGELDLEGAATSQEIDISGSGEYQAGNLQSERADVKVSGSGDVTVWVTDSLDVSISGSGSVNYYGSPAVSSSTSGSGELNGLGEK